MHAGAQAVSSGFVYSFSPEFRTLGSQRRPSTKARHASLHERLPAATPSRSLAMRQAKRGFILSAFCWSPPC